MTATLSEREPEHSSNAGKMRGSQDHYAAYLANTDGFEVELVARAP